MTPKKKRRACSDSRSKSKTRSKDKAGHLQLLEQLEQLELADSCCDICHCDCYSTHSSEADNATTAQEQQAELRQLEEDIATLEQLQRRESQHSIKVRVSSKQRQRSASQTPPPSVQPTQSSRRGSTDSRRRSKSAGSDTRESSKQAIAALAAATPTLVKRRGKATVSGARDCKVLQSLLGSLTTLNDSTALSVHGKGKSKSQQYLNKADSMALVPLHQSNSSYSKANANSLCASMASLCLMPTVRAAYQQVPTHDQKILNRMAVKRSEQAAAKEHAWLARKYWENERLERELLKCEQVEEYRRAVHDKQFQDYLLTKARLQALAQRDLAELQRLRESLHAKDEAAKQRIAALRQERDIQLCQRRCEELRRSEAVNVQQEEQQLDATLRKRDICMRLTQRLRRADQLRGQLLQTYLHRLQHDNYVEQLHHEEHWRERQQCELLKREQLKADIQRKRRQSQRFTECRQRRNEAITRTAKISASLRELVRQSVTPEAATGGAAAGQLVGLDQAAVGCYAQQQTQLAQLLFERPVRFKLEK